MVNRFGRKPGQTPSLHALIKNRRLDLLREYQRMTVGRGGLGALINHELIQGVFGLLPGALGYGLRKIYFPRLFRSVGQGTIFGRNIDITAGRRISIGANCLIGDNCELGVKGEPGGISIGSNVSIGRGTLLRTRSGQISIGDNGRLGAYCNLVSWETPLTIGADHLMAAYCYLSTGTHQYSDPDRPIHSQDYIMMPITIEADVWLGLRATVLAGSHIGKGCVIGACSLVSGEIPPYQVAVGVPAIPIKARGARSGSPEFSLIG